MFIANCIKYMLYGLESCQLSNADLRSLEFTFNRLFIKQASKQVAFKTHQ